MDDYFGREGWSLPMPSAQCYTQSEAEISVEWTLSGVGPAANSSILGGNCPLSFVPLKTWTQTLR